MSGELENMRLKAAHDEAIRIAIRMLASNDLSIEKIAYFSGLTVEEINALQAEQPA